MAFQQRKEKTPRSVPERLFTILDAFGPDHSALTLSEISQITGLPVTTTFRMLSKLNDWGALNRGPDLRYRIGSRLVSLAELAVEPTRRRTH